MAITVTGVISRHYSNSLAPTEVEVRGHPLFKEALLPITLLTVPHSCDYVSLVLFLGF